MGNFVYVLIVTLVSYISYVQGDDTWAPTGVVQCRANDDCHNEHHCCSITPAFGKRHVSQERQTPDNWDFMVHYCLPWKNENATWCALKMQYSPNTPNYYGLCPCGPGLKCTPTEALDEKYYPRDKFGKCTPVTVVV